VAKINTAAFVALLDSKGIDSPEVKAIASVLGIEDIQVFIASQQTKIDNARKREDREREQERLAKAMGKIEKAANGKSMTFADSKVSASELAILERELTDKAAQVSAMVQVWLADARVKFNLPNLSVVATKNDDGKYTASVTMKAQRMTKGGGVKNGLVILLDNERVTGTELYLKVCGKEYTGRDTPAKAAVSHAPDTFNWERVQVSANRGSTAARDTLVKAGAQVFTYEDTSD